MPDGFCVTADAFQRVAAPAIDGLLERLSDVRPDDREAIRVQSEEIRRVIEGVAMPDDLVSAIGAAYARLGDGAPRAVGAPSAVGSPRAAGVSCAVRSSATAEDLPSASFAGQQDSYLNVTGPAEVIRHVRRCWASLFTERAVTYRARNGFDHRKVRMAVVVQRMVFPDAAGVMFTADPVTSNRRTATVEAAWGLGEALVSGLASGDVYTVRDDQAVGAVVAAKERSVQAAAGGGTREEPVAPAWRTRRVLTDEQAIRLVRLGRRIEAHFGRPQDIEWCLVDDDFHVVQSRPITTLFPVPPTDDGENHLFVSVGHAQMMTDAIKPLGLSVWQLTAAHPMHEAGGRLFVDIAPIVAAPAGRAGIMRTLGRSDPLIGDALQTVLDRGDFLASRPDAPADASRPDAPGGEGKARAALDPFEADPAVVPVLIQENRASVATLRREIQGLSGPALLDFIRADLAELRRVMFDRRSHQAIMAGMEAAWWLNEHLEEWLGERNAADAIAQSVPHNVTSGMGLALLDVADVVRPHPDAVAFLQRVVDEGREDARFLDDLSEFPGGPEARDAIRNYLDEYGMRCAGEIDITRTRWNEHPAMLLPTLLGHVRNFKPGAGKQRFAQGLQEARQKEAELLERVRALPDGERKAEETKQMIDRVRAFAGYREYPKYGMVSRYSIYKQALLGEADRLVRSGVLRERDDIFFLRFEELEQVVRTGEADAGLIRERRAEFRTQEALTPPRVLTSDGETITGRYRRDNLPPGALVGLPVSSGTVEGRARVVTDMARADLEAGDILVTAFTDPSWTPLFVAVAGLVTEVGGLMTHGAVIAREYGLPAVVGVEGATRLIKDGQRIRVHGTDGHVQILD
ncbi:pyruvate,water dikinase [Actinomadura rupiterrae]|nr:pyruvate,water dikinase [Actinomadura rupiterrae]